MTNIVVQIGLNGRLELDYLALPRFRVISEALESACHKYVVPKFILDQIGIGEQIHVVGVEMHPVQIERLKAQYKDIRNIHFLHRVLHSENAKAFPHFSYCVGDHRNNKEGEKYVSPAVTLETLFDEILALEGLEKGRIFGVWMNIEGSEREAINSIDWDDFEKPYFFKIAMHSNEIQREVSPILRENGYSQIAETEFYSEQEYTTFYHGLANPEPTSS